MALRQRAIQAEDKQERRDALLDAAEQALLDAPERMPNVAALALRAGLAKGTVYLYFPSKEELLLAVHERRIDAFFKDLIALVEAGPGVDFDAVFALARTHIVDPPLFLPLAARCFGLMAHSLAPATALAFKQRMAARLERAGAGVERHFPVRPGTPAPAAGRGVVMLRRSYALTLGLWQMSAAADAGADTQAGEVPPAFAWSYPTELEEALRALWQGMVGSPATDEDRHD